MIYDYECVKCSVAQERMVRKQDDEVYCPVCGEQMTRLIGAPTFILKGGGWYKQSSQPVDVSKNTSTSNKD